MNEQPETNQNQGQGQSAEGPGLMGRNTVPFSHEEAVEFIKGLASGFLNKKPGAKHKHEHEARYIAMEASNILVIEIAMKAFSGEVSQKFIERMISEGLNNGISESLIHLGVHQFLTDLADTRIKVKALGDQARECIEGQRENLAELFQNISGSGAGGNLN